MDKRRIKMPKKKIKDTQVKTSNPLVNGKCDERSAREVLKMIKDKDIQIVDLKFNDLPGLWQHFPFPPGRCWRWTTSRVPSG